jgi:hypothetical protein
MGLGFSPDYVMMLPANNQRATQRMSGMSATYQFDADAGIATGINSNRIGDGGVRSPHGRLGASGTAAVAVDLHDPRDAEA